MVGLKSLPGGRCSREGIEGKGTRKRKAVVFQVKSLLMAKWGFGLRGVKRRSRMGGKEVLSVRQPGHYT